MPLRDGCIALVTFRYRSRESGIKRPALCINCGMTMFDSPTSTSTRDGQAEPAWMTRQHDSGEGVRDVASSSPSGRFDFVHIGMGLIGAAAAAAIAIAAAVG